MNTSLSVISYNNLKNFTNIDIQFSRDLFMLSCLTGGINFFDIANLKIDNIVDNQLQYKRQKIGKRINLTLQAEALKILNYYSEYRKKNNYLFPISTGASTFNFQS